MIFGQLSMDDLQDEYRDHVCDQYGIGSMEEMSIDQMHEQITMLKQCLARDEKMSHFANILRQRRVAA